MVHVNNRRCGNQNPPVTVERKNGKRTKDMKMCFNAPASEVNEQRGHQHLSDGDGVASEYASGMFKCHEDGKGRDESAEDHSGENMNMKLALSAGPGPGSD